MSKKILIIDDEAEFRENIKEALLAHDYDVYEASDGNDGYDLAEEVRPDLILCDVKMQGMHGYATVAALKANDDLAPIPIVMMTGFASSYGERRGLASGADYYLSKPFTIVELMFTVKRAFVNGGKVPFRPVRAR